MAERTRRRAQRPRVYAVLMILSALALAAGVIGLWRLGG